MKATPTALENVWILEPTIHEDERGWLFESFTRSAFEELTGCSGEFVQDNHSHSKRGVLRGLHYQQTQPQSKLVRAVAGTVWDVAVDIDPGSPTFTTHVAVELSAANRKQLFIGRQYAHGFCVLSEAADVLYKCGDSYKAGDGRGVIWNDEELGIDWPVSDPIVSQQDADLPNLCSR